MSSRNTVVHSLHDIGLAAWFGGARMDAVGLNWGRERCHRSHRPGAGGVRGGPVGTGERRAIGAHLVGGIGLILGNRTRLAVHGGTRTNTIVKSGDGVSGQYRVQWLAVRPGRQGRKGPRGGRQHPLRVDPTRVSGGDAATPYRAVGHPGVTAVLIVLGAQQGEQQRAAQLLPALDN